MKKIFLISILITLFTVASCTESDNAVDDVLDNVDTTGAVLRTISEPAELLFYSNPDLNTVDFTIEFQQNDGGSIDDFKEVRVYIGFYEDQELLTPLSNSDNTLTSESLLYTLPSNEFEISDLGLPMKNIVFTTPDAAAMYPDAVYTVPSFLEVRLELEMSDGTVFSKDNYGSTISSGTYFNSPFSYIIIYINA